MRWGLLVVCLTGGCDRLLDIDHLEVPPIDAALPIDGPPIDASYPHGCSDDTREGYADETTFPSIAACAGAWFVPGLRDPLPACDRAAGNTGTKVTGEGCSAADLCAPGWHVCKSKLDVYVQVQAEGCSGLGAGANTFFASGQSGNGGQCNDTGSDDFWGCGTIGDPAHATCAPLDKWPGNECYLIRMYGGWVCPYPDEVLDVTKTDPLTGGGVLCCRDPQ